MSTAIPSSLPVTTGNKHVSLADTIKQIEQQIKMYGTGPYSPKQNEELGKLRLLLQKAKQEMQRAQQKSSEVSSQPITTTHLTALPSQGTSLPSMIPMSATPISVANESKVLDKRRLQELVREVDPMEQLDDDVEEVLLQVADDFIDNVVTAACQLAKHRKSNTLEVKDVQLHLERNWNMYIPGFGSDELRPYKKTPTTEAHKQRMALIKKTLKKF